MCDYNRYKKCKNAYENYVILLEYENYVQLFDIDAYIIIQLLDCSNEIETTSEYETIKFSIDKLKQIEKKLQDERVNYIVMRIIKKNWRKVVFKLKNEYEVFSQRAKINQYIKQKGRIMPKEEKEIECIDNIRDKSNSTFKKNKKNENICFSCMKFRSNECFGGQKCSEYRKAPTISKEEKENWPEYGTATFYRLKGYHTKKK